MDEIEQYLGIAKKYAEQTNVIIVSNIKGVTKNYDDYSQSPVMTEYLSILEMEEINLAIKGFGFSTTIYHDEADFIRDISGNHYSTHRKYSLVMSTAQKGNRIGRKSLIPSFCDLFELKYMSSNPYVVSLCRNKYHSSCLLTQHQIPTPNSWLYEHGTSWLENRLPPEGEKVIVKLNNESASIGLDKNNIITYSHSTEPIIHEISLAFNQEVIVQQFIEGYEVEVPFLNAGSPVALEPVGIELSNLRFLGGEILTYEIRGMDKYQFYDFTAYNRELSQRLQRTTEQVAKLLGIQGFGRIDYRIDKEGLYYVSDIATSPHIVKHSSYYYRFAQNGYTYDQMLGCLLGLSLIKSKLVDYDSDQN